VIDSSRVFLGNGPRRRPRPLRIDRSLVQFARPSSLPPDRPPAVDHRLEEPGAGFTPAEAGRILDPDPALLDVPDRLTLPRSLPRGRVVSPENLPREIQKADPRGLLSESEVGTFTPHAATAFVRSFNETAPVEELAQAHRFGQVAEGWYGRTATMINTLFGKEGPRFAALLASTSPKTSPAANLRYALRYWLAYQETLAERAAEGQGPPSHAEMKRIIGQWGRQGRVPQFEAHMGLAAHALSHADPGRADYGVLQKTTGKTAPKTDSFRQNVYGRLWAVTNDFWQAALGGYDQGQIEELRGAYLAQAVKVRLVAARRNAELPQGAKIAPAQVQAATWAAIRAMAYVAGLNGLTERNRRTAERLLAAVTHRDMLSSKDYLRGLQTDSVSQELVKRLGLEKGLQRLLRIAEQADQRHAAIHGEHPLAAMGQTLHERRLLENVALKGLSQHGSFNTPRKRAQYRRRSSELASTVLRAALLTQANEAARPVPPMEPGELTAATRIGLQAITDVLDGGGRPAHGKARLRYAAGEVESLDPLGLLLPAAEPELPAYIPPEDARYLVRATILALQQSAVWKWAESKMQAEEDHLR
jgi:hypothetical protein